jgi:hypothetical protein
MQAWPSEGKQPVAYMTANGGHNSPILIVQLEETVSSGGDRFYVPTGGGEYRAEVRSGNPRSILGGRRHNPKITVRDTPLGDNQRGNG